MGTPPLAQRLKSTPAIRRPELHRQDIPELAIEVATSGLGPLEYAHDHVPSCRQSLGQVGWRKSRRRVLGEDSLKQWRQFVVGYWAVVPVRLAALGLDDRASAVTVSASVERIDGSPHGSRAVPPQMDSAQVPACVAPGDVAKLAVACRDLETHAARA